MFYFFSVSVTGLWLNWSIVGCFLLIILFDNSANVSEEISSRKYSDYKKYKKNVPMFFPILGILKKNWK